MQFISEPEYTFDDVLIRQQLSDIESRLEVDFKPESPLSTNTPIISSNMNPVTGKRMAEKLARIGGLGVLPQDMNLERMIEVIDYIHNSDIRLDTPLTVTTENKVLDATSIINKKSHQVVIIVDKDNKPIGIIKEDNLEGEDDHTRIKDINHSEPIVGKEGISDEDAFSIMDDNRISSLPIINESGELIGILTKDDSVRNSIYKPSLNINRELDVAVALSLNGYQDRIEAIVNSGVNTIFLDTAHGFTKKMLDTIKEIRDKYSDIILVSGNVMSGEGTEALIKAGVNGVKVGIGPGAMCTTRMMTGVGRPQFTAVMESAQAARENNGFVIADGGIKYPRDLALSLAAGATHGMLGTLLAGTFESPIAIKEENGEQYKQSWGMASGKAVTGRTRGLSKFEQARRERFREGISDARIYYIKSLGDIVDRFLTGVVSSMTYSGARNLEEFHNKAIIGVQTSAGFQEGTPHGRVKK